MASLKEIAKRAGVSVSTVSRVLNGSATRLPISELTRKRVLAAAHALNYVPDSAARALRRGSTKTIAVLGSHPSSFSVHGHFGGLVTHHLLVSGVEVGYHLLLLTGAEADTGPYGVLADLGMADGILIVNRDLTDHAYLAALQKFPKPVVYVFDYPESDQWSSSSADDTQGGLLVTEHLLQLGHRRIGFVDEHRYQQIFSRRRAGWMQALHEAGIFSDDGWHMKLDEVTPTSIRDLELTALVAANDSIGRAIHCRLAEAGLSIPHQISLASIAQQTQDQPPPEQITCSAQPIHDVVGSAMSQLVAQIEKQAPVAQLRHPYNLVVQQTTAPPPSPS